MTLVDLDLFYGKVNFGYIGFSMEKSENLEFYLSFDPIDCILHGCVFVMVYKLCSIEFTGERIIVTWRGIKIEVFPISTRTLNSLNISEN